MKMSPTEAKAEAAPTAIAERPEYPYGLCIRICKEEMAKLGMDKFPTLGESFNIEAKAVVKSLSASAGDGSEYSCVELQIISLAVESDGEETTAKRAKSMFGDMEKKRGGPNS